MSEKSTERVVVTVDDAHVPSIQSVAVKLRSAGLQVSHVLPTSGIITGEVAQEKLNGLKSVSGVADVEPDEEMQAI